MQKKNKQKKKKKKQFSHGRAGSPSKRRRGQANFDFGRGEGERHRWSDSSDSDMEGGREKRDKDMKGVRRSRRNTKGELRWHLADSVAFNSISPFFPLLSPLSSFPALPLSCSPSSLHPPSPSQEVTSPTESTLRMKVDPSCQQNVKRNSEIPQQTPRREFHLQEISWENFLQIFLRLTCALLVQNSSLLLEERGMRSQGEKWVLIRPAPGRMAHLHSQNSELVKTRDNHNWERWEGGRKRG